MLPFPMIASGAFVGFLWLIYGLLIDNIFIKVYYYFNIYYIFVIYIETIFCFQVQNVVAVILCLIQLGLIFKYPKPDSKKKE